MVPRTLESKVSGAARTSRDSSKAAAAMGGRPCSGGCGQSAGKLECPKCQMCVVASFRSFFICPTVSSFSTPRALTDGVTTDSAYPVPSSAVSHASPRTVSRARERADRNPLSGALQEGRATSSHMRLYADPKHHRKMHGTTPKSSYTFPEGSEHLICSFRLVLELRTDTRLWWNSQRRF
jgi:hypothetical protein